jgi:hypothetical protein
MHYGCSAGSHRRARTATAQIEMPLAVRSTLALLLLPIRTAAVALQGYSSRSRTAATRWSALPPTTLAGGLEFDRVDDDSAFLCLVVQHEPYLGPSFVGLDCRPATSGIVTGATARSARPRHGRAAAGSRLRAKRVVALCTTI